MDTPPHKSVFYRVGFVGFIGAAESFFTGSQFPHFQIAVFRIAMIVIQLGRQITAWLVESILPLQLNPVHICFKGK